MARHLIPRSTASLAACVLSLSAVQSAFALDLKVKSQGEIRWENRHFFIEDNEPLTVDTNSALAARLELKTKFKPFAIVARGFARYDPTDVDRSAVFAEDAYVEWKKGRFRVRVGALLQNWTATEAFHPADIINSRYLDSNIENPEKRGEPTVAFRIKFLDGNVELYYMPFFVEPFFPSASSRQSFAPPGVEVERILALERGGDFLDDYEFTYQMGGRVQQTIGDADVSVHVISHIDRTTPQLLALEDGSTAVIYQPVVQYGGTYQQVFGGLIAKLEAAYRQFYRTPGGATALGALDDRPDYGQIAGGVEYGIPHEGGDESTLIFEGQTVLAVEGEGPFGLPSGDSVLALPLFQRDVLFGYRYSANDVEGREILVTGIVDATDPDQFLVNFSYSRRLGESFGLRGGLRIIRVPPEEGELPVGFTALNDEHQVYLELSKYF